MDARSPREQVGTMQNGQLQPIISPAPADPYTSSWRESVLSTRSLSYVTTPGNSRHPSITHIQYPFPVSRQNTLGSVSEYSDDQNLEMSQRRPSRQALHDIPELPDSVSNSLLFELPREIRDRIYSFCLTAEGSKVVEWPQENRRAGIQPQILRLCKIVRDEAVPLLYALNRLSFAHPSDANMFVRAMASPTYARRVALLELQLRAPDTRLWMPYLTSTDDKRSLQADFPSMRELHIRYKSNRWQHSLSPEANMKTWVEDSRLNEVINGLRETFSLQEQQSQPLPQAPPQPPQVHHGRLGPEGSVLGGIIGERDFLDYIDAKEEKQAFFRDHGYYMPKPTTPTIRITVSCRVHATHFVALTTTADILSQQGAPAAHMMNTDGAETSPMGTSAPLGAVREGEDFRGFTPVDLRKRARVLQDSSLGSASIACTPFASKQGILLALEIYCTDSRRDVATNT